MSIKLFKRLLVTEAVDDHADHDHAAEADAHDDHADEGEGINVDTFKIIMMICMIICVGFGFVPKVWGKCRNSENTLSFLNCFSAGIFLAMALVHMMPESAEVYMLWAAKEGIERPFPLPYVMYYVGYLLILSIDRVAARAYHSGHDHGDEPKKQ